jgi:hypothetical protein
VLKATISITTTIICAAAVYLPRLCGVSKDSAEPPDWLTASTFAAPRPRAPLTTSCITIFLANLLSENSMAELFTLGEAAAIAEIEPGMIRTALEKRAVTASRKVKTGKAVRYRFSEGDVLYLLVVTEFPFPLSKDGKESLAKVLAHGSKTAKH